MNRPNFAYYKGVRLRPMQSEVVPRMLRSSDRLLLASMRSGKSLCPLIASDILGENVLVITTPRGMPGWHKTVSMIDRWRIKILVMSVGKLRKEDIGPDDFPFDYGTLILDEIQMYRRHSLQFLAARRFRKRARRCWGLTGTPIDRDLAEIFYVMQLLDGGALLGTNRDAFLDAYCMRANPRSDYDMRMIVRPELEPELRAGFLAHADRYFDLAMLPARKTLVEYDTSGEQDGFLKELSRRKPRGLSEIGFENLDLDGAGRKNKTAQVLSGFYLTAAGPVYRMETFKPDALVELLRHCFDKDGLRTVVVWTRFIEEGKDVAAACRRARIPCRAYSDAAMADMEAGGEGVVVANPRSAGAGVDFSFVGGAIYYSESASGIDAAQSEARMAVYQGTVRKPIYYLVASHPAADVFRDLIAKKTAFILELLGGKNDGAKRSTALG